MWVLRLGLGFHLSLPKSPMDYFKMSLHVGIAYRHWFSFKGIQIRYWLFQIDLTCGYYVQGWVFT